MKNFETKGNKNHTTMRNFKPKTDITFFNIANGFFQIMVNGPNQVMVTNPEKRLLLVTNT